MPRALRVPAAMLAAAFVLAACGGTSTTPGVGGARIGTIPQVRLPTTIAGLDVAAEKPPSALTRLGSTYAKDLGFFSLRRKNVVQATLEVVHLAPQADWRSAAFRQSVVGQLAGGVPTPVTVSGTTVYEASSTGSGLTSWFQGPYLYVLIIRNNFATPRGLIEEAVNVRLS